MVRLSFVAALIVALAWPGAGTAAETRRIQIAHDGELRHAILDLAPGASDAPLLIVLHGGLAGPWTVRRKARVTLQNEGWVVAWPAAIDDWNDGRTDWRGRPHDEADDLGYLRKLVDTLAASGIVDPRRVFVAGPSIGGVMALRLLCDAPDLVAGAAVAIASFAEGFECRDGPPRPVIYIHGTEDSLMPPDGGRIGGWNLLVAERGRVEPVDETVAHLARRNGCGRPEVRLLPDISERDGSTVTLRRYRHCVEPLVHYVVEGGGHTWPGATPSGLGESIVGKTNQDFSATRAVQDFFRRIASEIVGERAGDAASAD